jgi:hypothetical protein
MLPAPTFPSGPPSLPKSVEELLAYKGRLVACLAHTNQALLSLSVNVFTANDWLEARFMVRQIEAEIDLLNWVLGFKPTTWLDDSE